MNNYTREDILRMVEEEDVGFIRLQFTVHFRNYEKHCNYHKPVRTKPE